MSMAWQGAEILPSLRDQSVIPTWGSSSSPTHPVHANCCVIRHIVIITLLLLVPSCAFSAVSSASWLRGTALRKSVTVCRGNKSLSHDFGAVNGKECFTLHEEGPQDRRWKRGGRETSLPSKEEGAQINGFPFSSAGIATGLQQPRLAALLHVVRNASPHLTLWGDTWDKASSHNAFLTSDNDLASFHWCNCFLCPPDS